MSIKTDNVIKLISFIMENNSFCRYKGNLLPNILLALRYNEFPAPLSKIRAIGIEEGTKFIIINIYFFNHKKGLQKRLSEITVES